MAEALGVVGAIAVECSPLAVDNDWLLATAESSELIVGVIGDLDAALSEFPQELERLRANPLFLGIRYGNLWGRDLGARMREGTFVANLRLLAAKGLVLESANPNPALISALLEVTRKVPELRVIVDHLPQAPPPQDSEIREKYLKDLQELARHPGVFVKGSEILRRIDGKVPERMAVYKAWLDEIWNIFGDDRMLFGSDWPNSDTMAPFANTFNMAKEYIQTRSQKAAEEYWWRNSVRAYGWKPRSAAQKALLKQLSLA
jgi:predicted TIM-barrel fold metal-dependent hydrolase